MRIDVITLFPELVEQVVAHGVVGRAAQQKLLELHCWNPRDYTSDRHRTVEQYGHKADVRFMMLDNIVSNGFQSWAWESGAQHGGWGSADLLDEKAAHRQCTVAKKLSRPTITWRMRQQHIFRINNSSFRRRFGGLPIGRRHYDLLNRAFDIPFRIDQVGRAKKS